MDLANAQLSTAVIIDTKDPKRLGRIKVGSPGKFDTSTMDMDSLPWVYPFSMSCHNSFSAPVNGSLVWLLSNKNNKYELYYIPYFQLEGVSSDIIGSLNGYESNSDEREYKNAEIIFSRNLGGKRVQMYFNEVEGINIRIGEDSKININTDGKIDILTGNGSNLGISISDDGINIGNTENGFDDKMVLGRKLLKALCDFGNDIKGVGEKAIPGPYTTKIGQDLKMAASKFVDACGEDKVLSNYINVN